MPIAVTNLSYTYSADTPLAIHALRGVDFTVEDGSFVGVVGAMGAGKSTLMQHLNGLIMPPAGTVFVDGVDVGSKGADLLAVRQRVGLVFQYPEQQLFGESVYEDVAFGPRNLGLAEDAVRERVVEALTVVGLRPDEMVDRTPFGLSGGQQRRVALAGVLAMHPAYLILDEPTAGLDPRGKEDLLQLLRTLHVERGMSIVLVTHHMEDVVRLAQKVIVLSEGRIELQGAPEDVFGWGSREHLQRLGLDVPAAVRLVGRLNERGWGLAEHLVHEDDVVAAIAEAVGRRV